MLLVGDLELKSPGGKLDAMSAALDWVNRVIRRKSLKQEQVPTPVDVPRPVVEAVPQRPFRINTEFEAARNNPAAMREATAALFQTSNRAVLVAVHGYLQRTTADLDMLSLRLVAAAAPSINNPDLVATLINSLPVTNQNIALGQPRMELLRQSFATVLPLIATPQQRVKLVRSLIDGGIEKTLESIPSDRLTDTSRTMRRKSLMKQVARYAVAHTPPAERDEMYEMMYGQDDDDAHRNTPLTPLRNDTVLEAAALHEVLDLVEGLVGHAENQRLVMLTYDIATHPNASVELIRRTFNSKVGVEMGLPDEGHDDLDYVNNQLHELSTPLLAQLLASNLRSFHAADHAIGELIKRPNGARLYCEALGCPPGSTESESLRSIFEHDRERVNKLSHYFVAAHASTPTDVLDAIELTASDALIAIVRMNRGPWRSELLSTALNKSYDDEVVRMLLLSPADVAEQFNNFDELSTAHKRVWLRHPAAPEAVLSAHASDGEFVDAVAANPLTSDRVLQECLTVATTLTLDILANRDPLSFDIAAQIAQNSSWRGRTALGLPSPFATRIDEVRIRAALAAKIPLAREWLDQTITGAVAGSSFETKWLPAIAASASLTRDHWQRLASSHDGKVAGWAATQPGLPHGLSMRPPVLEPLRQTTKAIEHGVEFSDTVALKRWDQLPNSADLTDKLKDETRTMHYEWFAKATINGLTAQVVDTPGELARLGERMGNCLANYAEDLEDHKMVVLRFDDSSRHQIYAVGVTIDSWNGSLSFSRGDVNSISNGGNLPDGFLIGVDALVARANAELGEHEIESAPATSWQPEPAQALDLF